MRVRPRIRFFSVRLIDRNFLRDFGCISNKSLPPPCCMQITISKLCRLFVSFALRDPWAPSKSWAIPSRATYSRSATYQPQLSSDQPLSAFLSLSFQVFHANFGTLWTWLQSQLIDCLSSWFNAFAPLTIPLNLPTRNHCRYYWINEGCRYAIYWQPWTIS